MKNRSMTRVRYGKNADSAGALEKWFGFMINYVLKVNGPMLFQKSKEFALKLDDPDSYPTDG